MSENELSQIPPLYAALTLKLPNRTVGKGKAARIVPGPVIRPGHQIPTEGIDMARIEGWLEDGIAYFKTEPPRLRDVKPMRRDRELNVSSVKKGEVEDNPLDNGISTKAGESDPVLADKLAILAEKQAERVQSEGEALLEQQDSERRVTINAGTGEEIVEGGEEFFEDDADSQVTS